MNPNMLYCKANQKAIDNLDGRLGSVETALPGKQDKLTFDTAPTEDSTNPVTSGGIYTALGGKEDTLTFDTSPTEDSENPVTSGGIYTALGGKQDVLTFDDTPTEDSTNPVTSGGVYTALQGAGGAVACEYPLEYDTVNEKVKFVDWKTLDVSFSDLVSSGRLIADVRVEYRTADAIFTIYLQKGERIQTAGQNYLFGFLNSSEFTIGATSKTSLSGYISMGNTTLVRVYKEVLTFNNDDTVTRTVSQLNGSIHDINSSPGSTAVYGQVSYRPVPSPTTP